MEDFLRKMKLVDDLSITLKVNKSPFIAAFRGNVDESDLDGVFSGAFDAFSSSKNLYRGEVNSQNFRIRKKRTFFNNYASLPIAKGRFIQREDNLVIETKINAWSNYIIFFYVFVILLYMVMLSLFLGDNPRFGDEFEYFIPIVFIIIHAFFMLGIPYYAMRRGVVRMKQELEREFYYIVSKLNHSI